MMNPLDFHSILKSLLRVFKKNYSSRDIFLLAVCLLLANVGFNLYNHYFLHLGYPYSTFLFRIEDRFADFFKVIDLYDITDTWERPNEYGTMHNPYAMPFSSVYYGFFGWLILLSKNKYLVYILLNILLLSLHIILSRKRGNQYSVIFLSLFTYPVIFVIDRGNFALLVYVLIFFALTTTNTVRASIAIAAAACLRITPLVFIIAVILKKPVNKKKTLVSLLALGVSIILMISTSIVIVKNFLAPTSFDPSQFTRMMSWYNQTYLINLEGLAYGSSLYMPTRYLASLYNFSTAYITPLLLPLLIFGIIGIVSLIKSSLNDLLNTYLTFEKVVTVLCISFILFMPVTADYYLLIMFLPLLLFPTSNYSLFYFLAYGILLGGKNIFFIPGSNISWQVFINPALLLILLFAEFDLIGFIKRRPTISKDVSNLVFQKELNPWKHLAKYLPRRTIVLLGIPILALGASYWIIASKKADTVPQSLIVISKPLLMSNPPSHALPVRFAIFSAVDTTDQISVECWAFTKPDYCQDCRRYITFRSGSSFYAAEAIQSARPDVVSFFSDSSVLNSGLSVTFNKASIKKDIYIVGILFKDSVSKQEYYSETEAIINSDRLELFTPTRLKAAINGTDSIRAFIDKIEDHNDYFLVSGWAFINGLSSDFSKTSLVLRSEDKLFTLNVKPVYRGDLSGYFGLSYNVNLAGFSAKIIKKEMAQGEYELCVMVLNQTSREKTLKCFNATINIERRKNFLGF